MNQQNGGRWETDVTLKYMNRFDLKQWQTGKRQ